MGNGLVWTRESRLIAAACWFVTGVIGFAVNFNLVPALPLDQLWKLWPLIPLVVGVSVIAPAIRQSHSARTG